jgi:hypothetical protein
MTVNYYWKAFRLGVIPEYTTTDGTILEDVVTGIAFIRTIEDSETNLSADRAGYVYVSLPDPSEFVPLDDWTLELTAGVVESSVEMATLDYLLQQELDVLVANKNLFKFDKMNVNTIPLDPAINIIRS